VYNALSDEKGIDIVAVFVIGGAFNMGNPD